MFYAKYLSSISFDILKRIFFKVVFLLVAIATRIKHGMEFFEQFVKLNNL
jgi:hypothetical protein